MQPPSTILVVDDSPVNLRVLVRTLQAAATASSRAKNGAPRSTSRAGADPDLILLDVMMPDWTASKCAARSRPRPDTRDTVVIFLSALGEVSDKVSGLELGAVRLHHQADSGRGGAGAGGQPPHPPVSRARAAAEPRSARSRAGQRRATCSAGCCRRRCPAPRPWRLRPTTRPAAMPAATTTTCPRWTPTASG